MPPRLPFPLLQQQEPRDGGNADWRVVREARLARERATRVEERAQAVRSRDLGPFNAELTPLAQPETPQPGFGIARAIEDFASENVIEPIVEHFGAAFQGRQILEAEGQAEVEAASAQEEIDLGHSAEASRSTAPTQLPSPTSIIVTNEDGSRASAQMITGLSSEQVTSLASILQRRGAGYHIVDGNLVVGTNGMAILTSIPGINLPPSAFERGAVTGQRTILPEAGSQQAGSTGRLTTETLSAEITAGPDAVLVQMAQDAQAKLEFLQRESLEGKLDMNRAEADGLQAIAQLRDSHFQELQRTSAADADDLRNRMSQLDHAIDQVSRGQVDPEQFLGPGGGRRLAFGVAVAIGQLASALGGGPNVALSTIERRIEQNIRAQEVNLAHGRASVSQRASSLQTFRNILGDDRAAREAQRALEYEATISHIRSTLTNARDPILAANGRSLIVGARVRMLQALAAASAGTVVSFERSQTYRSEVTNAQVAQERIDAVGQARQANIDSLQGVAPPVAPVAPEVPAQRPRRPRPSVPEPVVSATGIEDETALMSRPTEAASPLRNVVGQVIGFNELSPRAAETQSNLLERAASTPGNAVLPSNLVGLLGTTASETFTRLSPPLQAQVVEWATAVNRMDALGARLIEIAAEGAEVGPAGTRGGEAMESVQAMQSILRTEYGFGVPSAAETATLDAILSSPTEVSLWNVRGGNSSDRITGVLRSFRRGINGRLGVWNLGVGSLAASLGN